MDSDKFNLFDSADYLDSLLFGDYNDPSSLKPSNLFAFDQQTVPSSVSPSQLVVSPNLTTAAIAATSSLFNANSPIDTKESQLQYEIKGLGDRVSRLESIVLKMVSNPNSISQFSNMLKSTDDWNLSNGHALGMESTLQTPAKSAQSLRQYGYSSFGNRESPTTVINEPTNNQPFGFVTEKVPTSNTNQPDENFDNRTIELFINGCERNFALPSPPEYHSHYDPETFVAASEQHVGGKKWENVPANHKTAASEDFVWKDLINQEFGQTVQYKSTHTTFVRKFLRDRNVPVLKRKGDNNRESLVVPKELAVEFINTFKKKYSKDIESGEEDETNDDSKSRASKSPSKPSKSPKNPSKSRMGGKTNQFVIDDDDDDDAFFTDGSERELKRGKFSESGTEADDEAIQKSGVLTRAQRSKLLRNSLPNHESNHAQDNFTGITTRRRSYSSSHDLLHDLTETSAAYEHYVDPAALLRSQIRKQKRSEAAAMQQFHGNSSVNTNESVNVDYVFQRKSFGLSPFLIEDDQDDM
ncbi:hypothetical protein HK098_000291 [Nowakowskiella sp. JEL0407]|nr:hypothetical protein HK098_000291 [Nowakowskiella sp. JEL0407]